MVVVLPSPAGVGLIAVTRISLPSFFALQRVEVLEGNLGLVVAVGLEVLLGDAQAARSATLVTRCIFAAWAISMSDGM